MKWSLRAIGNWLFGTKEEEEIEEVSEYPKSHIPELAVSKDILKEIKVEEEEEKVEEFVGDKPSITALLVNSTLTVFIHNTGEEISVSNANRELHGKVMSANTLEEIKSLLIPKEKIPVDLKDKEKENIEINKRVDKALDILKSNPDFEEKDGLVYMKGINRALPRLLVAKFAKLTTDIINEGLGSKEGGDEAAAENVEYQSLKNFWFWCISNPKPEVAEQLYNFLERNGLHLNRQGFFYALRNVIEIQCEKTDKAFMEAVTNSYVKIKSWKKSPKNFSIIKLGEKEYGITKNELIPSLPSETVVVGNLDTLYKGLADNEANRYTDAHTRSFDIRVGVPVRMEPEACSWSTVECGESGLHFTLNEINYVGCGDTSMLVLINPAKVVGIGTSKGRCYEYLPVMVVPRSEITTLLRDENFNTLELDEWYAEEDLKNLEATIKEAYVQESVIRQGYKEASITTEEIEVIVTSLSKMKDTLSSRVVKA